MSSEEQQQQPLQFAQQHQASGGGPAIGTDLVHRTPVPQHQPQQQYESLFIDEDGRSESASWEVEAALGDDARVASKGRGGTGSSVFAAALNFTNSIVGAGCIGFGAAMANSGGFMSIFLMLFFAFLNKLSFDVLVDLALITQTEHASYEGLGEEAFGERGQLVVKVVKSVYSFGTAVAMIVIIRDNFSFAMRQIFLSPDRDVSSGPHSFIGSLFFNEVHSTIFLSTFVILPLCLLRDMTPLTRFSALKITTFFFIIFCVMYLWATTPPEQLQDGTAAADFVSPSDTFAEHWLVVKHGWVQSMGTFVFTFMSQNTVHLVFRSLRQDIRTVKSWRAVSTISIVLSILMCFPVGLFVYLTFWEKTTSNIFELFPQSRAVDLAQILLCLTILLTYPPSFFSCREVIEHSITAHAMMKANDIIGGGLGAVVGYGSGTGEMDTLLPLAGKVGRDGASIGLQQQQSSPSEIGLRTHVAVTVALWSMTLALALSASSLSDVLNLLGCALGTLMAFVMPAVFSFKLRGISFTPLVLLVIGGLVGFIGTFSSVMAIVHKLTAPTPPA